MNTSSRLGDAGYGQAYQAVCFTTTTFGSLIRQTKGEVTSAKLNKGLFGCAKHKDSSKDVMTDAQGVSRLSTRLLDMSALSERNTYLSYVHVRWSPSQTIDQDQRLVLGVG